MEREVDLNEISDGKLYTANDMVKAGCNDCKDCYKCCMGMGTSIKLDPLDVHRLVETTNMKFEELLLEKIELGMVDGIIIPNIKMNANEKCPFLNGEGRCSIHKSRPGFCRIFPLGRIYEEGSFKYFLQVHECPKNPKTKVKIDKWIAVDKIKENEKFVCDWHYFLKEVSKKLEGEDEEGIKRIEMFILNMFYLTPFRKDIDFYQSFNERLKNAKSALDI